MKNIFKMKIKIKKQITKMRIKMKIIINKITLKMRLIQIMMNINMIKRKRKIMKVVKMRIKFIKNNKIMDQQLCNQQKI